MTIIRGQDTALAQFRAAMDSGALHHAWLIAGPEGSGKGTFARIAALRMLAEAQDADGLPRGFQTPSSHPAAHLFAAGSHPDYRLLDRLPADAKERARPRAEWDPEGKLARNVSIDQVRALQPLFATAPSLSRRRVVVIDSIDDLERAAANALLKNLEEPPQGTVFLLVSHAPGRLLPTIRSRCRLLRFAALDDDAMAAALRAHDPSLPDDRIAALIKAGEGSVGRALHMAGLDLAAIDAVLADIARSGDPTNAQRIALGRAVSGKAAQPRYEAMLDRAPGFIAREARSRRGQPLAEAIAAWEAARALAASALPLNLDPATVAFEMGGHVARLAK
ncbi:DNA polymerase III subunit delta' [Sphingomonas gilva]|uniref:DNA polymerase III subunit delta n=1 Tax=Sphingomonas gilva TaxID=2305907 RepID=A0A396RJZ4_9SPHN|nr:DNA polymerase III subunit delta' [Sphingomonas gilva]RHW16527.1 DNA polymerase III subunit delta' [Sphingomonas gilva]